MALFNTFVTFIFFGFFSYFIAFLTLRNTMQGIIHDEIQKYMNDKP